MREEKGKEFIMAEILGNRAIVSFHEHVCKEVSSRVKKELGCEKVIFTTTLAGDSEFKIYYNETDYFKVSINIKSFSTYYGMVYEIISKLTFVNKDTIENIESKDEQYVD